MTLIRNNSTHWQETTDGRVVAPNGVRDVNVTLPHEALLLAEGVFMLDDPDAPPEESPTSLAHLVVRVPYDPTPDPVEVDLDALGGAGHPSLVFSTKQLVADEVSGIYTAPADMVFRHLRFTAGSGDGTASVDVLLNGDVIASLDEGDVIDYILNDHGAFEGQTLAVQTMTPGDATAIVIQIDFVWATPMGLG